MNVELTAQAADDYRSARDWYAEHARPGTAERLVDSLSDSLDQICASPSKFPRYSDAERWLQVPGFPYLIVYEVLNESTILIVAVAHERRRPGYWKS